MPAAWGRVMRTGVSVSYGPILCVNPANPYHWMAIGGKVVERIEETDPAKGRAATDNVNEMAHRYIDAIPCPLRDPRGEVRVLFKVRPTYVMTFSAPPNSQAALEPNVEGDRV